MQAKLSEHLPGLQRRVNEMETILKQTINERRIQRKLKPEGVTQTRML